MLAAAVGLSAGDQAKAMITDCLSPHGVAQALCTGAFLRMWLQNGLSQPRSPFVICKA
jgi:hypothetical protein